MSQNLALSNEYRKIVPYLLDDEWYATKAVYVEIESSLPTALSATKRLISKVVNRITKSKRVKLLPYSIGDVTG